MPTTFYTVPQGPLLHFGGIDFVVGHSLLLPGWSEAAEGQTVGVLGSTNEVDLAGLADLSQHGTYVWEYLIGSIGQTLKESQDELTALITARKTRNPDGTTGQVALLSVALNGYDAAVTVATAMARLVGVGAPERGPTWDKLNLSFQVPAGFSYVA